MQDKNTLGVETARSRDNNIYLVYLLAFIFFLIIYGIYISIFLKKKKTSKESLLQLTLISMFLFYLIKLFEDIFSPI